MKRKTKKTSISLKRHLAIYYRMVLRVVKVSILLFGCLFIGTDLFATSKEMLRQKFYNLTALSGFILENINIAGQVNMPLRDILYALNASDGTPIFAINLDLVKQKIETSPWVKTALVARQLPKTIHIAIVEKKPLALWQFEQKIYLIDEEGDKIANISNIPKDKFNDLLLVVGAEANIYVRNLIDEIDRYPELAKRILSAVRYGNRRWDLNLEQNIIVKMPDQGFQEAYKYLNALNEQDKLFNQNYKIINLRDPKKYYIE